MINELLDAGRSNAIPARDLIDALKIEPRDFYEKVEKERRAGFPICASKRAPAGYYLAATRREAEEYVSQVNLTAHEMRKTARLMCKHVDELPEA